jgi:glycerol-1-phosphate dehydrogenase [NAD(P)+]
MITGGMKVTYSAGVPHALVADTDVIKNAPIEMIKAGYGDIIGKYSALNDWKLAKAINGEYFCDYVYGLTMDMLVATLPLAEKLLLRDGESIGILMEALVVVGIAMSFAGNSRPASGSEHHLSHYFEITGLILNKPYFLHGTDVGYSTVVTAAMRERICAIKAPIFHPVTRDMRLAAYERIYRDRAGEVTELQREAGRHDRDMTPLYAEKWNEILGILGECPTATEIEQMLLSVGFDLAAFERMYGADRIADGKLWGIWKRVSGRLRPQVNFPQGISGVHA